MKRFLTNHWIEILVFSCITVYFCWGLSPDMTWCSIGSDQGSYVVAALHNAPAGLSGNPLYILLGSLITRLPGNPFWLLGLLSAIPMALTCIVIYFIVKKFTTSKLAPYIASLAFASFFAVWAEGVIAETYGLSLFVMSLVILFCVNRQYYWMAAMMALTVGLHPLSILVDFPCLWYAWWIEGHNFKLAFKIVGITLIGLVLRVRDLTTHPASANVFYSQNPFQNLLYSAGGYFSLSVVPFGPTLQRIGEDFAALGATLWCIVPIVASYFTKRKVVLLLGVIGILAIFFPFSSIYPQWIKYMCIPCLPVAILAGIGIDKLNWGKMSAVFIVPCLVFAGLNVVTYSPGKTVDKSPTQARQFYNMLSTLPDNALIIDHTWGHPDLAIYYYVVNTHDRISVIDYDTMVTGEFDEKYYKAAQKARGINYPSVLDVPLTPEQKKLGVPVIGLTEFAKEMQELNPERKVYVTYVKSSKIPMEFGLVDANSYYPGINNIPADKVQFVGN
jgi:hypothetical protein